MPSPASTRAAIAPAQLHLRRHPAGDGLPEYIAFNKGPPCQIRNTSPVVNSCSRSASLGIVGAAAPWALDLRDKAKPLRHSRRAIRTLRVSSQRWQRSLAIPWCLYEISHFAYAQIRQTWQPRATAWAATALNLAMACPMRGKMALAPQPAPLKPCSTAARLG